MKTTNLLAAYVFALVSVVGCNEAPPEGQANSPAIPQPEVSSSVEIDQPLPSSDIDLAMELGADLSYAPASDTITTSVEITNNGESALATAGELPVQLGLVIRGSDGEMDRPPAKQDFLRIPLPEPIGPGEKIVIPVAFPATPTLGGIVVLDGVQEGVSWFSSYGEPTLEIGRFNRCVNDESKLCFVDGSEVPTGG